MRMKSGPRCGGCKYSQGGKGNDFLCGLLRTKDDQPALVVTMITTFERYENCAYRCWDRMMSATAPLSAQELIELARQQREPIFVTHGTFAVA
ncbi:hypothetical protein A2392_01320 [Candidatus Kaiserbacteria bacterium RIFOXYB1_FULL_46_14]|uniref:Uncharacterized protein n=1 Tax=Candidatus Kaiserbacteria bacterium RIFOXYB1_FULL_46_14 TaxID=1798531 RepID=A0A1F6FJP7_9BACT|nr:MAG: hypothetical protein A2392_01320 [Candidatus Kaiserbacteria bacterium RIFOXYB1_FULL_46_14]